MHDGHDGGRERSRSIEGGATALAVTEHETPIRADDVPRVIVRRPTAPQRSPADEPARPHLRSRAELDPRRARASSRDCPGAHGVGGADVVVGPESDARARERRGAPSTRRRQP